MLRKIVKGFLWLLLAVIVLIGAAVALNWTLVRNIMGTMGKPASETAQLQPVAEVKGCGERALPVAATKRLPDGAFKAMQAYSDSMDGFGLVVLVDGEVQNQAFGKGVTAATRTQTFSMNKTVTALMAGISIRDGAIANVDAPVGPYLTEWADDPRGKIPLRAFLAMESGLKNYSLAKQEWPAMKLMLSDDIEETALSIPVLEAPFTRFNYKNADSQIAGAVIRRAAEKAGKGDYASYLSSALWCPLGNAPATLWLEQEGGAPRFYAGLQANLMDWARLGQMLLDQGKVGDKQVVPADWISAMTTPSRNNPNYGLQVWLGSPYVERRAYNSETSAKAFHSKPYLADDVIYLDGFGGQRVYVVPSRRLVIARTGNPNMTFDDAMLVNLALAALPAPSPTPQVTP